MPNRFGPAAALALAGCLLSAPAEGADLSFDLPGLGPTAFQMTSTTLLRYRGDNYDLNDFDDDFFSLYQRFDMWLQSDRVRAELRIDAFVPFVEYALGIEDCPPLRENRCYLDWDVRPERFAIRWQPTYEWTIEGGDSQLIFGRGVALAFRKVDLLGVDNALRGGHVRFQGKRFQFRVHGGLANPQDQDPINLAIIDAPEDVVLAGTVGTTFPGKARFKTTLQALRVWFSDDEVTVEVDRAVDVLGLRLDLPSLAGGQLALYAEGNALRRTQAFRGTGEQQEEFGRGIYASAQLVVDRTTLLLELKDYSNYLVAPSILEAQPWRIYNAAPLVDYDGPQRLRGIGNQRGASFRVDYAFLPGPWSFAVNTAFYGFNEEVGLEEDPFDGVLVSHSWLELVRRQVYDDGFSWGFSADLGARFEFLNHPVEVFDLEPGDLDRWMIHGMAEATVGIGEHSLDLTADHRHEQERVFGGELRDFEIGGTSLTYSYGIRVAATLGLQWTDFQEGVIDARESRDYNFLGGKFYPFVDIRYFFTPGTFVNAFVGQTPGGQICSGGVCRDVPPFEGFSLQFVARI
jgi:hypothetical protein